MSIAWRDWCRLCATSGRRGVNIFETSDFVWPDRIVKYLSISISDEDDLPQTVCEECCQRITTFDRFAEQCLRVQTMFRAMSEQTDESNSQAVLIRAEYLEETEGKSPDTAYSIDNKKDVELLAMDLDPYVTSNSRNLTVKNVNKLKPTRKKLVKMKAAVPRVKSSVTKVKVEDPERRSSRLQVLAQTQIDFGIDPATIIKHELDICDEVEVPLPKKRGRPPKQIVGAAKLLVGAAKRKAKKPRVVKTKKILLSDDDFDDLGMEIKPGTDKVNQPSIFRWECHICGEMARNWNSLSMHTRRVHEVAAQVMCLCAKVLSSRASIIKHRLKHTDGFKYKCEKCEKSFHRRGCYELHVLSHVPKEEQPFVCCKCARRFHCEALLRQHEKVHLPREERLIYPCNTCQKKFSSKSAVSAHIKSIHFGERPFVCDQCGHSFTSKGILQEHLTIHSDETPFKCQHCHKSFKTKYRLKIHLDIHRETPYQCPVCPLQLSTRRTLRMHLVVHKDTKAFQCSTCGKAFRRAKDLKNHHNLHTGRRPYTCTFCPRTFANGSNCRSHKRRMHPEELRIYEAALAAADSQANNPTGAPTMTGHIPPSIPQNSATNPPPSTQHEPTVTVTQPMNVPNTSNQQMTSASNHDFQRQFGENSIKHLHNSSVSRTPPTLMNSYQSQNSEMSIPSSNMNAESQSHNSNLHSDMPAVSRNNVPNARNNHQYVVAMTEASNDCSVNRTQMNTVRRMNEGMITSHVPNLTPLNLNISELHSNRQHQMSSNLGIVDADRHFHNQRSQMPNLNQGHIPNLHQIRQQQNFGLNRGVNERIVNLNRTGRDLGEVNRSGVERELGNSNLSQMHHNSEHGNILQGYTTSLNPLYQHPSSVAAAMAHSSTVGVPAFPGNPYVHHGMGTTLTYQRGNGNM